VLNGSGLAKGRTASGPLQAYSLTIITPIIAIFTDKFVTITHFSHNFYGVITAVEAIQAQQPGNIVTMEAMLI
jgi:hypothetical protein